MPPAAAQHVPPGLGTPPRTPANRPSRKRSDQVNVVDPELLASCAREAVGKLHPRELVKKPVLFVVAAGSVLTTLSALIHPSVFTWVISVWLWLTVLFANLAEAVAEGRGRAQAESLRKARTDTVAVRLNHWTYGANLRQAETEVVTPAELQPFDFVLVGAGELVPADGDVVDGAAMVDESAVTGESAPVLRESGGDHSGVTGGTTVLSDTVVVRVTSRPGHSFIDRMIALVEGATRQKTPNEIALNILLAALTVVFVLVVVSLQPMADYAHAAQSTTVLVALLVTLIPTTIGALLSAIGIAGMDRLVQRNVIAMSGRAVEAAGDVNTLLLDKTGTITLGNREAVAFIPLPGVDHLELADAAQLSSLADETPEGRSVVDLAQRYGLRPAGAGDLSNPRFTEFSARTRMSGVNLSWDNGAGCAIRKGATAQVCDWVAMRGGTVPAEAVAWSATVSESGGTPLLVAVHDWDGPRVLGIIHLKDVVKEGIRDRFEELRRMGIRTVMVTGDNELTARAIAAEAGVDEYLAEATPEDK
ncbi:potassium-transporting ATPase subunit KdpB, partial [Streptomyces sp. NPDC006656]|uniref:potassium-transporting ATPase subunit KdpB n=1 Tax=Streptomyces sp. NPDC006656 TaxID=3156899 RepID=UPI00345373F2